MFRSNVFIAVHIRVYILLLIIYQNYIVRLLLFNDKISNQNSIVFFFIYSSTKDEGNVNIVRFSFYDGNNYYSPCSDRRCACNVQFTGRPVVGHADDDAMTSRHLSTLWSTVKHRKTRPGKTLTLMAGNKHFVAKMEILFSTDTPLRQNISTVFTICLCRIN